jgi:hypothetical protein
VDLQASAGAGLLPDSLLRFMRQPPPSSRLQHLQLTAGGNWLTDWLVILVN